MHRCANQPIAGPLTLRHRRQVRRHGSHLRWLWVLLLSALLVLGLPRVMRALARPAQPPAPAYVTVMPGDTLWSIAGQFTVPGEDIRQVVHHIRRANGVAGGLLQPGMVLKVPPAEERS